MAKWCKIILVDSLIGKYHVIESYNVEQSQVKILPFYCPPYDELGIAENIQTELPFNDKSRYLIYPAQFWKHKNHINLLRAIKLLQRDGVMINIVFTGSPKNNYDLVNDAIKELELSSQVIIFDYVSMTRLNDLIKHSSGLVMASFLGPTNIPPLEAFSYGIPVVASRVYGVPDQLHNAAIYFNPNDIYDISIKLNELWNNNRKVKQLVANGYKWVENWNKETFTDQLLTIIHGV